MTDSATQAPRPASAAPGAAPAPGAASGAGTGAGTAIRTEDLRKTYKTSRGDVPAVRGIDLNVPAGELFGLLGPNGAGKSTTIGMLTTLVLPTGGRAWVAGIDVVADPVGVKRRIGVVTQNNTLDMQLTVTENLEFRSRFFGLGPREAARRAAQLIDAFGLGDRSKAMATDLSGGQARRLLIARALVHRPEVLFLDEPTAGLDPQTRVNLWDILRVLHDQGQSILLTTHYMEEAERLCDRIVVMDHGQVIAADTLAGLQRDHPGARDLEGVFLALTGRMLRDFGADVIKVERPRTGDELRRWRLFRGDTSLFWSLQGRNKRSITLDLRTPEGQEIVLKLLPHVDVVLENFRPGTLEKWNLGYEAMKAVNPDVIFVRISGYGQTGPYRDRPGFGGIAEAMGGLRHLARS